jgi:hypothetical protein
MAKVIPIEVSEDAWPKIAEAGEVTLTVSDINYFQFWIFMFTHGYASALLGAKLTDDEVSKVKQAAEGLQAALRDLGFGLGHRLETADNMRRQAGGRTFLTDLTVDHLRLIQSPGLPKHLKLLDDAIDMVLATPVRKKAERNLGTRPFMEKVKAYYDTIESREAPRKSKWRAFFHEFYEELPQPTKKLLVTEAAALKQLENRKRGGHGEA